MRTMAYRAAHGAVLIIRPFDAHVTALLKQHNVEIIAARTAATKMIRLGVHVIPDKPSAGHPAAITAAIKAIRRCARRLHLRHHLAA